MFLKLLQLVLVLVLIRFVVRLVRGLLSPPAGRSKVPPRSRREEDPPRGGRIIDVEFTEDADDPGGGRR
jgi:hypothetical protein